VLVDRYVNLLRRVDPEHILASPSREKRGRDATRIVERLKEASRTSELDAALAGSSRAARRHRDLDHRRLLPRAPSRVPTRG
jgi:hypothetical protein